MSSIPPPSSSPGEPPAERPMTIVEATLWVICAWILPGAVAQLAWTVAPNLQYDTAMSSMAQAVAYMFLLVVIQTVYFPKTRPGVVFGTRGAAWYFYPLAAVLGVAIQFPASALYEATLARWPDTAQATEIFRAFDDLPLWRQAAAGVALVLVTPLIEEAFFRGALFGTLRRRHSAPLVVIAITALFAMIHGHTRLLLPIGMVGAALTFMRVASGSMWPGVVLHMSFNGLTFYANATSGPETPDTPEPTPVPYVVVGTVATAGLLALADFLRVRRQKLNPTIEEQQT